MREILKNLYGITEPGGFSDDEYDFFRTKFGNIPEKLIEFYSLCGNHKYALNCYDEWVTPGDYKANEADIDETAGGNLMLLNENQGVCCAVILKDDLGKDDPPVYVIDGSDESPYLSVDNLEDFIKSVLVYEAVFAVLYSSERILELSKSDYEKAAERLEKLPYHFGWAAGFGYSALLPTALLLLSKLTRKIIGCFTARQAKNLLKESRRFSTE